LYSDPIILIGDVTPCARYAASLGVGNWLLEPVKISELTSANGLVWSGLVWSYWCSRMSCSTVVICGIEREETARGNWRTVLEQVELFKYRGADKSFAGPGRKQATATEDFDFHIPYL